MGQPYCRFFPSAFVCPQAAAPALKPDSLATLLGLLASVYGIHPGVAPRSWCCDASLILGCAHHGGAEQQR